MAMTVDRSSAISTVDLPRMAEVVQDLPTRPLGDVAGAIRSTLESMEWPKDLAGRSVAVLVGSRGVTNITTAVLEVVEALRQRGAAPFLVPAMGSHGGGTSEGQAQVLIDFGLDPARTGVPIRSSLRTVLVGTTLDERPVYIDANAAGADHIFVVARVKPHTTFKGDLQSGMTKLLVVGCGKVDGARSFHSAAARTLQSRVLEAMCNVLLSALPILGGLALVEDAQHNTAIVEAVPASSMIVRERELLDDAKALMPSLPVEEADILIIDEMGKDISGAGIDPNVTGRRALINARWQEDAPRITRIVVLDLTPASHGNATGIGLADFAGPRLIEKLDRRITYLNAMTGLTTVNAMTPLYFDTDRETIEQAALSLVADGGAARSLRVLHIRSTLDVARFAASEALVPELRQHDGVRVEERFGALEFRDDGSLVARPPSSS
jgi:hypothetical protein